LKELTITEICFCYSIIIRYIESGFDNNEDRFLTMSNTDFKKFKENLIRIEI